MPAPSGPRNAGTHVVRALFAFIVVAASGGPARAVSEGAPPPGRTTRITIHDHTGEVVDPSASSVSISPDGRSFLIRTWSPLVSGDTNGVPDIYLMDRASGSVEWISVTHDGSSPNGEAMLFAWRPSQMSDNGRYVAFPSRATNMTAGTDANGTVPDIFVRDRVAGTTSLASVSSEGAWAEDQSVYASVSDGGEVAFLSFANNLVAGDTNSVPDVFVHDFATRKTERVSVFSGGGEVPYGVQSPYPPEISGNGRYVVFEHRYPLDPTDPTLPFNDIFVHDRVTDTTERVSVASDGSGGYEPGLWETLDPVISYDGRYVAFRSGHTTFVPNDTNDSFDGFVHDRETGRTERLVGADGQQWDQGLSLMHMSADGRFLVGHSTVSNLGFEDGNGTNDVFRIDRLTGQVDLVSATPEGATGNDLSHSHYISSDGRYVTFWSNATDIMDDGAGGGWFLRDLGPSLGAGDLSATANPDGVAVSGWARVSAGPIATVDDSDHDAAPGARNAGAELIGARITYRPERGDLRIRLDLAPRRHVARQCAQVSMPGSCSRPGVLTYLLRSEVDGVSYEARAVVGASDAEPDFGLYRCVGACAKVADLAGGIGTAGENVLVSVPLGAIGAAEGSALADGFAQVALGEQATGQVDVLDEVALPDVEIASVSVVLGIAPRGTPETAVAFEHEAELVDGRFSGTLPVPGPGEHDAWARVCFFETCASSVAAVEGQGA